MEIDAAKRGPVWSHNEWDPLEEVIVGRIEGATIPSRHTTVTYNVPDGVARLYPLWGGLRYPRLLTDAAKRDLAAFVHLLEAEGVRVRRPDPLDFKRPYRTPHFASRGFCVACPRDAFLVIGDEILETPTAWPSRYFEAFAYRRLFKEYFQAGARWTSAPKPELSSQLWVDGYAPSDEGEPVEFITTEHEPVFDAADFVRCGRDLFCIRSNVSNRFGIEWLRRHLGDGYRIHEIESHNRQPMHIDTTFMPLAPGKVLVNPRYLDVDKLPPVLKHWDVLVCPTPQPISSWRARFSMCSPWISMNVLMLDAERVVVEKTQESMIRALRDWGFRPIPCAFMDFAPFGGSFHCATLDVRRRGELESYF